MLDGCSLPWLAWFDRDGTQQEFRFVKRGPSPTGTPRLESPGHDRPGLPPGPAGAPTTGRDAEVDVLVPSPDGLFVVYNERDRSQAPERRRSWIGLLA